MRVDIVMTSYRKDLQWLHFNLQFLLLNWKEHGSRIIVRLDRDCEETVSRWAAPLHDPRIRYVYVDPWPDGYHWHMYLKMTADEYTDADLIILVDSDVILFEPADTRDLMENGKPIIYYLDWICGGTVGEVRLDNAERKWREPTSRLMGMDLDRDYMVATPFTFWRSTFMRTRAQIERVTGKSFKDAVYSERPYDYRDFLNHQMIYADYEALGLYAAKQEPNWYVVKPRPQKHWKFHLFWSHGWSFQTQCMLQDRLNALKPEHVP